MDLTILNLIKDKDSLTIDETALGYGASGDAIFELLQILPKEFRCGIEYILDKVNVEDTPRESILIYPEGVIKLGFFVNSPVARKFRREALRVIGPDAKSMTVKDMLNIIHNGKENTNEGI